MAEILERMEIADERRSMAMPAISGMGESTKPREWTPAPVESDASHAATTGHKVWPAAQRLVSFLEKSRGEWIPKKHGGTRILELGAGTGFLGLTIALNTSPKEVSRMTMTERQEGMELLERNVATFPKLQNVVHTCVCDWNAGCASDIISETWDLVIGSDLVYEKESLSLIQVWKTLLTTGRASPRILYCHTKRRYEDLDYIFFDEIEANGLTCVEVFADGEEVHKPPSPPPYSEAFPETRIAIYFISLKDKTEDT